MIVSIISLFSFIFHKLHKFIDDDRILCQFEYLINDSICSITIILAILCCKNEYIGDKIEEYLLIRMVSK